MMYLGSNAVGLATSLPTFSDAVNIEYGEYTPSTDEAVSTKFISHSLGVIPDFVFCMAKNFQIDASLEHQYLISGYTNWSEGLDIDKKMSIVIVNYPGYATSTMTLQTFLTSSNRLTTSAFQFPYNSSKEAILKSGITYAYVIGKFKEVTSNA